LTSLSKCDKILLYIKLEESEKDYVDVKTPGGARRGRESFLAIIVIFLKQ
jgi:hypothetical protein